MSLCSIKTCPKLSHGTSLFLTKGLLLWEPNGHILIQRRETMSKNHSLVLFAMSITPIFCPVLLETRKKNWGMATSTCLYVFPLALHLWHIFHGGCSSCQCNLEEKCAVLSHVDISNLRIQISRNSSHQ